jgi:hypothetical protein
MADEHGAHAAALGHVDDLLLRRPSQHRDPVFSRGETHDDVERLDLRRSVRSEYRKFADRYARQLLHHPTLFIGKGALRRGLPLGPRQAEAQDYAVAAEVAVRFSTSDSCSLST